MHNEVDNWVPNEAVHFVPNTKRSMSNLFAEYLSRASPLRKFQNKSWHRNANKQQTGTKGKRSIASLFAEYLSKAVPHDTGNEFEAEHAPDPVHLPIQGEAFSNRNDLNKFFGKTRLVYSIGKRSAATHAAQKTMRKRFSSLPNLYALFMASQQGSDVDKRYFLNNLFARNLGEIPRQSADDDESDEEELNADRMRGDDVMGSSRKKPGSDKNHYFKQLTRLSNNIG